MKIWIDTDVGSDVDDALTLAYALRHPGLELVGVSTVFGDVELRSEIARGVLAAGDANDVPVHTGLGVPLTKERIGLMFGHEGKGILPDATPRLQTREDPDGPARIAALADALEAANPDVIVAIGPLSNLAALLEAGVALPELAIMGGKLTEVMHEGMVAGISEWNWYCDPLAVQHVLDATYSALPRVVPADVTFRTRLAEGDVERLAQGDALARQISTLSAVWLDFLRDRFGREAPRVALHDPLTAAVLVEGGLCPFEEQRIRVDDAAVSEQVEGPANIRAATDVDVDKLRDHLMETWL